MNNSNKNTTGIILIAVATILFGTMETALKYFCAGFHPIQILFIRYLVTGLFLMPVSHQLLKKENKTVSRRDWMLLFILGFCGIAVSMTMYQLALVFIEASVVGIIYACNVVFTAGLAYVVLKEKITKARIIALGLDVIGLVLIIRPWQLYLNPVGIVLALCSMLIFVIYSVCGKRLIERVGGVTMTCYAFLFGCVGMLIYMAVGNIESVGNALIDMGLDTFAFIPIIKGINLSNIGTLFIVCIIFTAMGNGAYFAALGLMRAQDVGLIFMFKPILASIAGYVVLHETLGLHKLIGLAIVFTGSVLYLFGDAIAKKKGKLWEKS